MINQEIFIGSVEWAVKPSFIGSLLMLDATAHSILLFIVFILFAGVRILYIIAHKLTHIQNNQFLIINKQSQIMTTLSDLQTAVAAEKTVIDSAITLLKGLHDKIAALEPNQEAIDALAAEIKTSTDSLSSAVTENTDPIPVVNPE